jgi:hypothetical protein
MQHPAEKDLALLAGGETGRLQHFLLEHHVHGCEKCQAKMAEYQTLRSDLREAELLDEAMPDVNWNFLAADMRANIRLGLEAGACVRETHVPQRWNFNRTLHLSPRFTTAFALLLLLVGSSLVVRNPRPLLNQVGLNQPRLNQMRWGRTGIVPAKTESSAPVLESSSSGVAFRTGGNSLTLLNHHGDAANQTVSARGDIGTRYVDSETESITINYVYLQ